MKSILPSLSLNFFCAFSYSPPLVLKVDMPARDTARAGGSSACAFLQSQTMHCWRPQEAGAVGDAAPRPPASPEVAESPLPENTMILWLRSAAASSLSRGGGSSLQAKRGSRGS